MHFLADQPFWVVAAFIFCTRILDVSIGTLRTISVVQGRLGLSVCLGFFEVLIWTIAISQVISGIGENPVYLFAYAGGFAAGNAVGIRLERFLALGHVVVRMISPHDGLKVAKALREEKQRVTTFTGEGREGPVLLIYMNCHRRKLKRLLKIAIENDPTLFYTVEPVQSHNEGLNIPLPHRTGWRAFLKMK
ncbi:DUF5698 domain-containing protein [Blastopirellula sp. JC732]|uniref:DUF5698 domain-containing protein n=1 Tax=Blastopirellula sediminis TaxID=2894196 RepID=A0A9X1MQP9_9BACT|nr:DUF5698 domain-containing protein [Blastopirellula sediminis]MCC9606071.1 DUF5698 domain-containing protein [Blastopirellula sediminis]MCC9630630.1 DUF5698 domain-containing protein [Blastopirellula sediminis]